MDTIRDPETHPELTPERTAEITKSIPIGCEANPGEFAWVCAFLCSKRSAVITGAVIHVDGGLFMFG
jgi:3-oxoacyl-[acyl-carrier protein] reductase